MIHQSDLKFLVDTAVENGLQCFINDQNDLEIKDNNICFHYANLLSGELDAYDRWKLYHDSGIRCVFIYPPDLSNPHKINIYKNIHSMVHSFLSTPYMRESFYHQFQFRIYVKIP